MSDLRYRHDLSATVLVDVIKELLAAQRSVEQLLCRYLADYVHLHHIQPREVGGEHSRSNGCLLCTTHHSRVHEGELVIEGDADGELRFLEPGGAELGGLAGGDPIGSPLPAAVLSEGAVLRQVLAAMDGRGGWHPDQLCQRSGIPYRELTVALLELRLAGTVRCDPAGLYRPG